MDSLSSHKCVAFILHPSRYNVWSLATNTRVKENKSPRIQWTLFAWVSYVYLKRFLPTDTQQSALNCALTMNSKTFDVLEIIISYRMMKTFDFQKRKLCPIILIQTSSIGHEFELFKSVVDYFSNIGECLCDAHQIPGIGIGCVHWLICNVVYMHSVFVWNCITWIFRSLCNFFGILNRCLLFLLLLRLSYTYKPLNFGS